MLNLTAFDWILLLNAALAVVLIFIEEKRPRKAVAWLLIMIVLPVAGPILFIIFGQNLRKQKASARKETRDRQYVEEIVRQHRLNYLTEDIQLKKDGMSEYRDMMDFLVKSNAAFLTVDNKVKVLSEGPEKMESLFQAIREARDHVHVEYYIIRDDDLGHKFLDLLAQKQREGVQVRLLVDGVGTRMSPRNYNPIKEAGGKVEVFFPPLVSFLPFLNHRINYRNHRKIVVVDGKVGFVGGFNIGDEYVGKDPDFGHWRDSHVRIEGRAVLALQLRFLLDWNYISSEELDISPQLFPPDYTVGEGTLIQIINSGPDKRWEPLKLAFLKIIYEARESLYIETPYFVPDESVRDALAMAAMSGVDVRVIIPEKPDHPFVHWVSLSYIGELHETGVRGYLYRNGFLHAKTVVVDGKLASIGSANWDIRSFELNFETNAIIYSPEVGREQVRVFMDDISQSRELTKDDFQQRPLFLRLRIFVSRLFTDIL